MMKGISLVHNNTLILRRESTKKLEQEAKHADKLKPRARSL